MRVLIWHVEKFVCTITERGRSPIVEENELEIKAKGHPLSRLARVIAVSDP